MSFDLRQVQESQRASFEEEAQLTREQFANFLTGESIENLAVVQRNSIVVLDESFKYLSRLPGLKKNLAQFARNDVIYYSLIRSPGDRPDRPGSFHRGRRSLFMDLGSIDKSNFFITLIHELAHGVDDVMRNAIVEFGSRSTRTQIFEILERKKSSAQLNLQERDLIRSWLTVGLERGLLAEYRAWLFTYLAYQEGLRDGTLQSTEWLERLHNTKPADSNIETHIYRTLHQSWQDPSDDIFAHPVISELLRELRQELYDNPNLIRMGNIGKLITG